MKLPLVLGCLLLSIIAVACSSRKTTPTNPIEALAGHDYFMAYVKPTLETQCVSCHSGRHPPAKLSLVQSSSAFAPRQRDKPYIIPGDPNASLLITSILPGGSHPRITPPLEYTLTDRERGALWEWVEDGAHWPAAPDGFLQPRLFGETESSRPPEWTITKRR